MTDSRTSSSYLRQWILAHPIIAFPLVYLGWAYLLALLLMAIKGPIEEVGWRGRALPLLQCSLAPIYAASVLGAIWAIWHPPAFPLSGTPQSDWSLPPFFAGTVALSVQRLFITRIRRSPEKCCAR
jgi:membrane protease YdiL (CAAX protease family)